MATYQLFGATGAPVAHQAVDLITGQFIPDPANPGTGNQRLFTNLSSTVEYTPPSDTNFTPPTIDQATGIVVTNSGCSSANFNVVATPAPGGSPVKEVLVLFTDSANPGTWTPVYLTLGASGAWTGGAPAPASGKISYIVQAVDGDGNVSMNSEQGRRLQPGPGQHRPEHRTGCRAERLALARDERCHRDQRLLQRPGRPDLHR